MHIFKFKNQIIRLINDVTKPIVDITAKFLIVLSSLASVDKTINKFVSAGILNVAAIYSHKNRNSAIIPMMFKLSSYLTYGHDSTKIFPDKLKNLNRNRYQIVVADTPPYVSIGNGKVKSKLSYFLEIIKQKQNAGINYQIVMPEDPSKIVKIMYAKKARGELDLILNTIFKTDFAAPQLMTYEENGYCPLVPLPQKTSISKQLFVEPFDKWSWLGKRVLKR